MATRPARRSTDSPDDVHLAAAAAKAELRLALQHLNLALERAEAVLAAEQEDVHRDGQ